MSEKRTKTTWLDHPKNVNRLFWGLVAIGVGLTVADLAYHKHALFEWEGWFGFEAFYGFLAVTVIVVGALALRRLVMRPEDYYERHEDSDD
jgi:uncharacterized membrane protein